MKWIAYVIINGGGIDERKTLTTILNKKKTRKKWKTKYTKLPWRILKMKKAARPHWKIDKLMEYPMSHFVHENKVNHRFSNGATEQIFIHRTNITRRQQNKNNCYQFNDICFLWNVVVSNGYCYFVFSSSFSSASYIRSFVCYLSFSFVVDFIWFSFHQPNKFNENIDVVKHLVRYKSNEQGERVAFQGISSQHSAHLYDQWMDTIFFQFFFVV